MKCLNLLKLSQCSSHAQISQITIPLLKKCQLHCHGFYQQQNSTDNSTDAHLNKMKELSMSQVNDTTIIKTNKS